MTTLNISEMRLGKSTWARPIRKQALSTCNDAVTSGGSGSPLSSAEDPRLPLDVSATVGGGSGREQREGEKEGEREGEEEGEKGYFKRIQEPR